MVTARVLGHVFQMFGPGQLLQHLDGGDNVVVDDSAFRRRQGARPNCQVLQFIGTQKLGLQSVHIAPDVSLANVTHTVQIGVFHGLGPLIDVSQKVAVCVVVSVGVSVDVAVFVGVKVTDALPATLTFVSASGAGFTCTRTGQNVSCDLGTPLAAGATAAVTIAVRAPTTGQTINNEGVVSTTSIDRNPANNRSSQSTRINDRTAEDLEALLDDAAIDPASQAALPVVANECAVPTSALAEACPAIVGAADAGRTPEVTETLHDLRCTGPQGRETSGYGLSQISIAVGSLGHGSLSHIFAFAARSESSWMCLRK